MCQIQYHSFVSWKLLELSYAAIGKCNESIIRLKQLRWWVINQRTLNFDVASKEFKSSEDLIRYLVFVMFHNINEQFFHSEFKRYSNRDERRKLMHLESCQSEYRLSYLGTVPLCSKGTKECFLSNLQKICVNRFKALRHKELSICWP